MMVLDLDKVASLEAIYKTSGSEIALESLHQMVSIVSQSSTTDYLKDSVALSTLEEMGVLVTQGGLKKKGNKQLNS